MPDVRKIEFEENEFEMESSNESRNIEKQSDEFEQKQNEEEREDERKVEGQTCFERERVDWASEIPTQDEQSAERHSLEHPRRRSLLHPTEDWALSLPLRESDYKEENKNRDYFYENFFYFSKNEN